eukprot:GEMP01020740.1.p1 GENE.GEMP01020740.1~~GEMP01020740.1.p1  ORF type:complete len:303 (+),score=74.72 GEMP01020740.1:829-1737(+)
MKAIQDFQDMQQKMMTENLAMKATIIELSLKIAEAERKQETDNDTTSQEARPPARSVSPRSWLTGAPRVDAEATSSSTQLTDNYGYGVSAGFVVPSTSTAAPPPEFISAVIAAAGGKTSAPSLTMPASTVPSFAYGMETSKAPPLSADSGYPRATAGAAGGAFALALDNLLVDLPTAPAALDRQYGAAPVVPSRAPLPQIQSDGTLRAFEVVLTKPEGTSSLGIDVSHKEDAQAISVEKILENGAVALWNEASKKRGGVTVIHKGDRIVRVNTVHGGAQEMLEECRRETKLEMTIHRTTAAD